MMNKKYFNIHSYKRFYMGGRVGDQSAPALKDLSFTIVPKQRLVENPGGNILVQFLDVMVCRFRVTRLRIIFRSF